MDKEALKQLSGEDLLTLLQEKREELRQMRFKSSQGQLGEIRKIRDTKLTIARILTFLEGIKQKQQVA